MLIFGVQTLFYPFPSILGIPSSPASDPCSTVHVSCLMCPQCPHWALTSPAAAHSLFLSPPPPLVSWATRTVLHQPIPAPLNDRAQNQVLPFHLIWEQVGRTWWTWEGMG